MSEKTIKQRVEVLEMLDECNTSSIRELREKIADLEGQLAEIIENMRREDDGK